MRFLAWLKESSDHPKRAVRYLRPRIAAYWWDGGAPTAREVKDISTTGAFLYTAQRWYPGTILTVTLQEDGKDSETESASSISLPCMVVRHESKGVGVRFMFNKTRDREVLEHFVREVVVNAHERGQALLEFAAAVPMLFLLIVLAMNFGGLINAWITVENATRAAADYAILNGDSAGNPVLATSGSLQALVNAEMAALPNLSSTSACVRKNDNGTFVTLMEMPPQACGSYANPPSDSETVTSGTTTTYATVAVDVTYTYTSFFSGNSFIGLPLTVLPGSVHRRTVMRIL